MVIVVMGVAGSGKSTVGAELARVLGWRFVEGDAFHPPGNVQQMKRGQPLSDADRQPWLAALRAHIAAAVASGEDIVVSCSALKQSYRQQLCVDPDQMSFVYLKGAPELIARRLSARKGHFMPSSLLPSQLADLEESADALVVDIDQSPALIVADIRRNLRL